jgi:hypothetical protein
MYIYVIVYDIYIQDTAPLIHNAIGQDTSECSAILDIMQKYHDDAEVQQLACAAIHMIAQKDPQAGDNLGREGACKAVIAAILKHTTSRDLVTWGLSAVLSLAKCKPVHIYSVGDVNITRPRDDGVCSMIVLALTKYSNDGNIAPQILQIVNSLACSDSGIRDTLIAGGACEAICISSESRQSNLAYAQAYCEAVYSLALDSVDGKQTLFDAGAIEALEDILHWHKSADVITGACKAVKALVDDSNEHAVRMINAASCSKLVWALTPHIDNPEVAAAVCQAIQTLALNDVTNRFKLGKFAICECLAEAAKTHSNSTVVLTAVYTALDQLAANNKTYPDPDVHISVINAITEHIDNAELVRTGCSVLIRLLEHDRTEMMCTVANDGLYDILPKILKKHINSSGVVCNACLIIQYLAHYKHNRVKLGDAGAYQAVIGVLTNSNNAEAIEAARGVIHSINCLATHDTRVEVIDAGV